MGAGREWVAILLSRQLEHNAGGGGQSLGLGKQRGPPPPPSTKLHSQASQDPSDSGEEMAFRE